MRQKKKCSKCGNSKFIDEFSPDLRKSDKLQSQCTKCRSSDNKDRKEKYFSLGKCKWCGINTPRENRVTCEYCEEQRKLVNLKLKLDVFEAYGGTCCACCKEDNITFLTIDHINNDGSKHRKTFKISVYRELKRTGYPTGFQVLCWNCNLGKYYNGGICPHK